MFDDMNEQKTVKRPTSRTSSTDQPGLPGRSKPSISPKPSIAGGVDLSLIGMAVLAVVAAFFIYRTVAMQSQVTKARNESTQLRSQVGNLQTDLKQAQDKTKESSDLAAQLQAQANKAQADVASAKASAEKASGEAANLRTQLDQAKRQAADAKASADKVSAQLAKLQAQIQAQAQTQAQTPTEAKPPAQPAPVKPVVSNLKPMPLSASFKKAQMLDGNALTVQNTSTASLSVAVKFSNQNSNKVFQVTLEPGAMKEMGWLGPWVLTTGDKVEIESPGYETIIKTAP
jgi:hypothetical protein